MSQTDEFYDKMPREQVVSRLKELNEYDENDGLTKMRKKKMKITEQTRHLQIWHDHSTLANHGHIFFMVSCLYDQLCILKAWSINWKQGRRWMFRRKWRNQKYTLSGDAVAVIQNNLPM